jgi:hypothetical protein
MAEAAQFLAWARPWRCIKITFQQLQVAITMLIWPKTLAVLVTGVVVHQKYSLKITIQTFFSFL